MKSVSFIILCKQKLLFYSSFLYEYITFYFNYCGVYMCVCVLNNATCLTQALYLTNEKSQLQYINYN